MSEKEKNIQELQEANIDEIKEEVSEEECEKAESAEETTVEDAEQKEELEENAEKEESKNDTKEKVMSILISFGVPALSVLAFLFAGIFGNNGWRMSWLFLIIIPIYWSGLVAFYKKNPYLFLFPLLALGIYLFIGLAVDDNKGWNPYWLILLEIPLYYLACWLIQTILNSNSEEEVFEEENEPEPEPELEPKPEPEPEPKPAEIPVHKVKKQISHRREKLAQKPKQKKVNIVTEDKNYDKGKKKVKLKAEITHNEEAANNSDSEGVYKEE